MALDFWQGRRVFLTGHTGFKGAWLSLWLAELGAEVHGYALDPPTTPNLFELANVGKVIGDERGDIRDIEKMRRAMAAFKPQIVIHAAAQAIVRESYEIPLETYDVNVMGTAKVLEVVRGIDSVAATIVVTSDKCYENRETIWAYRETDAMGGFDPYSSSKGCAELVTAAYARSFFTSGKSPVASVRAGNVVGGGDWAKDRLVPDLFRGLIAKNDVIIRSPHSVRPWQHVLEPLSGYLAVAQYLVEHPATAWEGWNFGPDSGSVRTVQELASAVTALWGTPEALSIQPAGDGRHEAGLLSLDSTKARTLLNWRPRWDFAQTVEKSVAWYRGFATGQSMDALTRLQIAQYQAAGPLT